MAFRDEMICEAAMRDGETIYVNRWGRLELSRIRSEKHRVALRKIKDRVERAARGEGLLRCIDCPDVNFCRDRECVSCRYDNSTKGE